MTTRVISIQFSLSTVPGVVYHGTASPTRIETFNFQSSFAGAAFFTDNPNFAKQFAFDDVRNGLVQEQVLNVKNAFDFRTRSIGKVYAQSSRNS